MRTNTQTKGARLASRAALPVAIAALLFAASPLVAQSSGATQPAGAAAGGASQNLTIGQAVADALKTSSDVQSAVDAWNSAREKTLEARLQMLPSLSLSGSYTRLSQLPSSDTTLTLPFPPPTGPINISIPSTQNAYSFGVSLQYPIFSGFRLLQAAKIAELQSTGKQIAIAIVRNALTFEVERAYWEAVRAGANVATMKKNLELSHVLRDQMKEEVNQGLATQSDLLGAEERYNQAQISLNDSISARNQAYLALSSLVGQNDVGARLAESGASGFLADASPAYDLSTNPAQARFPQFTGRLDAAKLVAEALASRPELRTAEVGVDTAKHAAQASQGALYPTLALVGNYTYADPNQRVLFQTSSQFTGTWNVGVAVNIDVGKLPANAAGTVAARKAVGQAEAAAASERTKIVLDVRRSLLGYEQAKSDVALTQGMVKQAEENLRVTQQKYDNGLAKRSDVLEAELALLRAHFSVTNEEVALRVAAADLARAVGSLR